MSSPSSSAPAARALYRRILRVALHWEGPLKEQQWIRKEARLRFEENRSLKDSKEIEEAIQQGHNQVDVALFYKIPYPRPQYIDYGVSPDNSSNYHIHSSRANVKAPSNQKLEARQQWNFKRSST